jgi:DNA-binding transcriptional ArsR family regulator
VRLARPARGHERQPRACSYIAEWLYSQVGGDVAGKPEQLLEKIADRLKAMADPMRLRILHELQGGERCVNDILGSVGGSQANVSKHLSVLKRAGLVDCRREGVSVYYRIDDPTVFAICQSVCSSLEKRINAEKAEIERGRIALLGGKA